MKEYRIWGNSDLKLEDWIDDLKYEWPDGTEDTYYELMEDTNEVFYESERDNLYKELDSIIIARMVVKLWDGRKTGYKIVGRRLEDILDRYDDLCKIYTDGDVRYEGYHHDGWRHIIYRKLKPELTPKEVDNILKKIDEGTLENNEFYSNTVSLRPDVAEIYGWTE